MLKKKLAYHNGMCLDAAVFVMLGNIVFKEVMWVHLKTGFVALSTHHFENTSYFLYIYNKHWKLFFSFLFCSPILWCNIDHFWSFIGSFHNSHTNLSHTCRRVGLVALCSCQATMSHLAPRLWSIFLLC